jgi:hypothetical protein
MTKQRILCIFLMAVWVSVFFVLVDFQSSSPPRSLTVYNIVQLSLIPMGAFLVARPGVPRSWFVFFSLTLMYRFVDLHEHQVRGTLRLCGWDQLSIQYPLYILCGVGVVVSSVVAGAFRQRMHICN